MDLPLADMWIFAAVARYGSVTGAARTLEIPKSTVSRRLAALEEWLGVRILSRSSRSLTLTDAGQAFLEHCLRLSEVAEDASAFAQEVAGQPRGTLRVTMPPGFGEPLLAPAIARFTQRNPALTVEIDESPRFVDLVAERFDLAFRSGALPDSTLVSQRLSVLETGLFASPDYLSRNPAPRDPSDLADHHFAILRGRARFDRLSLLRGQQRIEVPLRGRVIATTSAFQLALGLAGAGVIAYTGPGI